ncbi:MAG: tetratricopeptide repeat protein [Chitinophagaceae bacterium]|nr:MAG: tetratricopeptide repeat protein [Chitinophagaceae bacterium]
MKYLLLLTLLCATRGYAQAPVADSLYNRGDWPSAAVAYRAAVQADSSDVRLWFRLGNSLRSVGAYAEAVSAYRHALLQKPGVVPPVFIRTNLAQALVQGGSRRDALAVLDTMLRRGWGNFPELDTAAGFALLRQDTAFSRIHAWAHRNAFPCSADSLHRAFDFWVGSWIVYQTGTQTEVGRSRVDNASGGCLILENWTASIGGPNEGKSMNFIDPATGAWKQVWMGSGGQLLEYVNGRYRDGAMRFEGSGRSPAGQPLQFHLSFFNNSGDVRQLLEQSADEGRSWQTLYDFTYRRP